MNKPLVVILAVILVLGALATWLFWPKAEAPAAVTPPPAPVIPDKPIVEIVGKSVNAQTILTKKFFEPKEIVVGQNDIVNVYVSAMDTGLTVFVPSDGRRYPITRGTAQLIAVEARQNMTLVCAEGCDANTVLTITVQ